MPKGEKERTKMDKEIDSLAFSSHTSRESESSLDEETFIEYCASEEEEEYVQTLMEREIEFGFNKDNKSVAFGNLVKRGRLDAIAWILKARELFGFRYQTACLSITYFDRFLSRRPINNEEMWLMKLLPLACLSLAAKMEEPKIPSLSDFRLNGDNFGTKLIERMELFVLSTLDWRMSSITLLTFLHYFLARLCHFDQSLPTNILARTTPLIMATMREINLMDHRPSSIAAAAALVALEQKLTRKSLESKMKSISCCKFIKFEDVFSFYNMMSELKVCQEWREISIICPNPNDALEASSVTNSFSFEKKRLNPRNCSFECGVTGYKRFRFKENGFSRSITEKG